MMKKKIIVHLFIAHATLVFAISMLLTVTKWFPYGSLTIGLREWLYKVF